MEIQLFVGNWPSPGTPLGKGKDGLVCPREVVVDIYMHNEVEQTKLVGAEWATLANG